MAQRLIVQEPHKVLRSPASEVPVEEIQSERIRKILSEMKESLKATPDGVGLAAPQIGESLRIFIVSEEASEIDKFGRARRGENKPYEKRDWKYYVYINPRVKSISKTKLADTEGCLSVRGKFGVVERCEKITMVAFDESGKKFIRGASKFFARVIQHELDHLAGVLFIDKAKELYNMVGDTDKTRIKQHN